MDTKLNTYLNLPIQEFIHQSWQVFKGF